MRHPGAEQTAFAQIDWGRPTLISGTNNTPRSLHLNPGRKGCFL